jgi:hypothetical protein
MPSRRTVLGAAGTGVALALSGCTGTADRVEGYVQLKSIDGLLREPGRTEEVSVLKVYASHENGTPPELAVLDEEWADRFPVPRRPVVPDGLHDALTDRFDAVRYVVGTTSPGWAGDGESFGSFNVATTRENFNRVQVHTAVTASSDGTYLTIHSVDGLWEFDSTDR